MTGYICLSKSIQCFPHLESPAVSINVSQQRPTIPSLLFRNQNLLVARSHKAGTVPWRGEDGRRVAPGRRCCSDPLKGRFGELLSSGPAAPTTSAAPVSAQLHHWSCNNICGYKAAVRPCFCQRCVML